jgi:hypothetical protein
MQEDNNVHRLLNDRVAFRLHAAEQHLNRLKEIESLHGGIAKNQARLEVEMEIDCFLSQIVGAVDSLLLQINAAFDLGVSDNRLTFQDIQSGLSAKTKQIALLDELGRARQPGKWFSVLSELRNQSMHYTFLKKITVVHDFPTKPAQIRFLKLQRDSEGNPVEQEMQQEVIAYLEKSLEQVSTLINSVRKNSPLLQPSK